MSLSLAEKLVAWYDQNGRSFPWRIKNHQPPNPYYTWISEVMLQQTTTATVIPYFQRFIAKWPTIEALADAKLDDVLHQWQGLGYYARARNLHRCAQTILHHHQGQFPCQEADLLGLPGIGPYTAAAISAIAFGQPTTPIDGNIVRVVSRLYGLTTPLPSLLKEVRSYAQTLTPLNRPGDYAQAIMDLGATICMPRNCFCHKCPWQQDCIAYRTHQWEDLPKRRVKKEKQYRYGVVFWLCRKDQKVMLRRRPETGLLGGMIEFPSTPWLEKPWQLKQALGHAPLKVKWFPLNKTVTHTFTHFHLNLTILYGSCDCGEDEALWDTPHNFSLYALPTVMKKVVHAVTEKGLSK